LTEVVKYGWTQEELDFVRDCFQEYRHSEVWDRFPNIPRSTISTRAGKEGWRRTAADYAVHQSALLDHNIFDELTPLNAYIGGVLCSDGCMYGNTIKLEMSALDKDYVENLGKLISPNLKLEYRAATNAVSWRFSSKRACEQLNRHFNMTPKKSLTLQPPNLSEESHIKAYILGQWDGDGSAYYHRKHKNTTYLDMSFGCASLDMVEWVADNLPVPARVERDNRDKYEHGFWQVRYYGKNAAVLQDYLYDPSLPCLDRKWNLPWKRELQ